MTVESTTQALCDLALRFGEGDEESMVRIILLLYALTLFFGTQHFQLLLVERF